MVARRHVMVALCALCTCLNYADRVNMSVAIISIAEDYSFTLSQQSAILSFFFLGYIPMNVGGAVLCRRMGGKPVLQYGAALWSLFTILTPIAASLGLPALLACRVCMGLSEGVAFPGVYHFLSTWIPPEESGRSISIFLTGAHVGTMLALVVSPLIIRAMSWQAIFYIFGATGYVWVALWQVLAHDNNDAEKPARYTALPTEDPPQMPKRALDTVFSARERRLVVTMLSDRRCLAVCMSQALFSMAHYVILSWLPTFFRRVYDVGTTSLSFTCVPYLAMAIFANVGGWLADRLLYSGMERTRVRKVISVLADGSAAICVVLFALARDVNLAIMLISLCMACLSLNSGGFEVSYLDMASPGAVGMFKAVCTTTGSLGGFLAIPLSTVLLDLLGGSWRAMFGTLAICFVLKMVVFCAWATGDRVLVDEGDE